MPAISSIWDSACTPLDSCHVVRESPRLLTKTPSGFRAVSALNQRTVEPVQAAGSDLQLGNNTSFDFWIPELESQGAGSAIPEFYTQCAVAHEGGPDTGPVSSTLVREQHGRESARSERRGDAEPSTTRDRDNSIAITTRGTMRDGDPTWQAVKRTQRTLQARDSFNSSYASPTRSPRGMREGAENSLRCTPEPGRAPTNLRRRTNEIRRINTPRRTAPLTAQQRQRLGLDRRTVNHEDVMLM